MNNKNIIKSGKHHRRYLENIDYVEEVMTPHIAYAREQLSAEISSMDIIDDVMHDNILKVFDRVIHGTEMKIQHDSMSRKRIEKIFNNGMKLFDKKIKPKLFAMCQAIHDSKMTAKHGGALSDGFELSQEWAGDVEKMLFSDRQKNMNRKSNIDGALTLVQKIILGYFAVFGVVFLGAFAFGNQVPSALIFAVLSNFLFFFNSVSLLGFYNQVRFDAGQYIGHFLDDITSAYRNKAIDHESAKRKKKFEEDMKNIHGKWKAELVN